MGALGVSPQELDAVVGVVSTALGEFVEVGRKLGSGLEGEAYAVEIGRDSFAVLKVGRLQGREYSDFAASAKISGVDVPGIAYVFGTWLDPASDIFAILREEVNTDWPTFSQEFGVEDLDGLAEDLDDATDQFADSCMRGSTPTFGSGVQHLRGVFGEVLEGLEVLAMDFELCAGTDVHLTNLGWRDDGTVVVIDLGWTMPMSDEWVAKDRGSL